MTSLLSTIFFFFFNDTATTEIYTLSLHDALPISGRDARPHCGRGRGRAGARSRRGGTSGKGTAAARFGRRPVPHRSEEHTSELQSQSNLVCRLLLEKKKNTTIDESSVRRYQPRIY